MRQAILSTGVPYTRAENPDNNSVEIAHFIPLCSGIRRMGSCAIDLAQVASGAYAVHWERDLNAWDIAPGALMIGEAGGIVTDYDGNPWNPARARLRGQQRSARTTSSHAQWHSCSATAST
jgi:myo-inositol-1(or 4)-monophosphatase